jgi:two-component system, sensor histidine kinase
MINEHRQLIFNQVDNAIALFNPSHHLILFNQKFIQLWGLSSEWLAQSPHFKEVWARVVEQGYWSTTQSDELELALPTETSQQVSFRLEQADGIHLTVKITVTADGGHLFTFHDITAKAEASLIQMSLNAEIKRLRFLQGLTERMQSAEEMREIGQFALAYLVAMLK